MKTPDQNTPGPNTPGRNSDLGSDQNVMGNGNGNGNGDNDKDIDKEFRHNTPHESQPERAERSGKAGEEDFDPESEKLVQRNTAQQSQKNPRNDETTTRR